MLGQPMNPHVHFTHEDSPYFKDLFYLSEDFKRELNERCLENFQVFVRESEIKLAIENLVGRATFREES